MLDLAKICTAWTDARALPVHEAVVGATVVALGGSWDICPSFRCGWLFAQSQNSRAYQEAQRAQIAMRTPAWLEDFVASNGAVEPGPYEWPQPIQHTARFSITAEQARAIWSGRNETLSARKPFKNMRVLLSRDHTPLTQNLTTLLRAAIESVGGQLMPVPTTESEELKAVENCDVYIRIYRDGAAYEQAVKTCRLVGTPQWLQDILSKRVFVRPTANVAYWPQHQQSRESNVAEFRQNRIFIGFKEAPTRMAIRFLVEKMWGKLVDDIDKATVVVSNKAHPTALCPTVGSSWLYRVYFQWKNYPPNPFLYAVQGKTDIVPWLRDELKEMKKRNQQNAASEGTITAALSSVEHAPTAQVASLPITPAVAPLPPAPLVGSSFATAPHTRQLRPRTTKAIPIAKRDATNEQNSTTGTDNEDYESDIWDSTDTDSERSESMDPDFESSENMDAEFFPSDE